MSNSIVVRSVWANNFFSEMSAISYFLGFHGFVSIDTEFPGVIHRSPIHPSRLTVDERYALIKNNVDALQLIQVGISLFDAQGQLPKVYMNGSVVQIVWEFNLRGIDISTQPFNLESVELLKSKGINFWQLREQGIDPNLFATQLMASGLVSDKITWITFHSAYDFAYLVKCLTHSKLPERLVDFMEVVKFFFGKKIYDVKNIAQHCNGVYGGLEQISNLLQVERMVGMAHQAGSDALLIGQVFRRLKQIFFPQGGSLHKHACVLYGVQVF